MFWTEKLVEALKDSDNHWVDDMATASGKAHVGTLRGACIHDVAAKALKKAGKKVKFTFISNDFDPMDGIPSYVDKEYYEQFMGLPMFKVPAPEGPKNFADYYMDDLFEIMKGLGCDFQPVKDSEEYTKGTYDKAIKLALDNADDIRRIYKEVSGSEKPKDWYPFHPICENCGKIGTTRVFDWDGKEVSYICEEDMVDWAKGCGHQGKINPFKGNGKLPWKVDWPAHWYSMAITVEGEGKDHASAGGSRDLANHLCKEVFKINPPYDLPYEHIIFGGKKMSKSKGIGISAEDVYAILPPEIIRFVMIRNIDRVIDLDLSGMVVPNLFDEYDKGALALRGEMDFPDLAKAFEFSQIKEDFNKGYRMRFSKLAYAIQMPNIDVAKMAAEENGSELTSAEKEDLETRIRFAKIWLEKFAPEEFRFEIKKETPQVSLSNDQKNFLSKLAISLKDIKSWDGDSIKQFIFDTKNETDINPKDGFVAIYRLFLGKDSGPQAAWLLASLEKDFVIKRLSEIN